MWKELDRKEIEYGDSICIVVTDAMSVTGGTIIRTTTLASKRGCAAISSSVHQIYVADTTIV